MDHRDPGPKRLLRLARWLIVVALAAFAFQIGLLAFPQLLLTNKVEAGSVVVFYDGDPDPTLQAAAEEADHRLRSGGFGDVDKPERIFFFNSQGLYALFARLARVPVEAQGFSVSLLGTTYVSGHRVRALGELTGRLPNYSIWEGDVSHTMAHEVAHLIMVDSIGRSAWKALPQWKREGYPEYVANIGLIREDSTAALARRIDILRDEEEWSGPRSWDRIHYEAGLLMQFLLDVEGLDLGSVLADSITRDGTYGAMLDWGLGTQGN